MSINKKIIVTILIVIAVVVGFKVMLYSMGQSEIVACHQLDNQSKAHYDGKFYITQWQDDMCNAHGIAINAPIK